MKSPKPVGLNEPAIWFEHPDHQGTPFRTLVEALKHAISIEKEKRHARAKVVTESGSEYGWDAIATLAKSVKA